MLCSRKFLVAKKFMGEGWAGLSRFSVENFCLTLPKNFVGEPVYVSPSFRYRKIIGIREGGGSVSILRRKRFCLTVPKNFVGEPFFVSQNFWYRKIFRRRGGVSGVFVEIFLSHFAGNFRRGTH